MNNSLYVLWFEELDPELLTTIPSCAKLAASGVDLRLTPSPLVEKGVCYYQTLTGTNSGKLGRFDLVYPERYTAREDHSIPEGALGRLLPDMLRSRKLTVISTEIKGKPELDALANQSYDCTIVRVLDMAADPGAIDSIVQRCIELANPIAHMFVLTDVWRPAPAKLVNVNDFLADVGLLEVSAPRNRANIVWPETLAYGLGTGQIWINLRGREPQGIVNAGREYQEVCDALVNELRNNWFDPQTKEVIVEQVLKKEDVYTGEYLFKAPDLIVQYRSGYAASPNSFSLGFDGESMLKLEGEVNKKAPFARLIGSGPNLVSGLKESASLIDVAPSVMYLLGQPISLRVDGKVISSMFTESYRHLTPEKRVEEDEELLSDEEEGLIVDRLRDLGYLG